MDLSTLDDLMLPVFYDTKLDLLFDTEPPLICDIWDAPPSAASQPAVSEATDSATDLARFLCMDTLEDGGGTSAEMLVLPTKKQRARRPTDVVVRIQKPRGRRLKDVAFKPRARAGSVLLWTGTRLLRIA